MSTRYHYHFHGMLLIKTWTAVEKNLMLKSLQKPIWLETLHCISLSRSVIIFFCPVDTPDQYTVCLIEIVQNGCHMSKGMSN